MIDKKYMRNGSLSLYDVAADIKNRKLTGTDVARLADEPIVQQDFFGDLEPLKQPRRKWNNKYLDELCMATAFKCFNREYLLYLDEVAEYVTKARGWKRLFIGVLIAITAVAAMIVCYVMGSQN